MWSCCAIDARCCPPQEGAARRPAQLAQRAQHRSTPHTNGLLSRTKPLCETTGSHPNVPRRKIPFIWCLGVGEGQVFVSLFLLLNLPHTKPHPSPPHPHPTPTSPPPSHPLPHLTPTSPPPHPWEEGVRWGWGRPASHIFLSNVSATPRSSASSSKFPQIGSGSSSRNSSMLSNTALSHPLKLRCFSIWLWSLRPFTSHPSSVNFQQVVTVWLSKPHPRPGCPAPHVCWLARL